ncbi:MAG: amidohydrolase family protein [Promethearchaeota archaeon]
MKNALIIKNVNVFDSEKGIFNPAKDILIEGKLITKVHNFLKGGANKKIIDCSGKYALPGLFECHGHLSFLYKEGQDRIKTLQNFILSGITQVRDVGGSLNILRELKRDISNKTILGPTIFYSGPMLERSPLTWEKYNQELPGFTVAVNTIEDADKIINKLVNQRVSLVKTFFNWDENVHLHLVKEANKVRLPVSHDPGPPLYQSISMEKAIEHGVKCIEHAHNPFQSILKRDFVIKHNEILKSNPIPETRKEFTNKIFSLWRKAISLDKLTRLCKKMIEHNVFFCPTMTVYKKELFKDYFDEEFPQDPKDVKRLEDLEDISKFLVKEMVKYKVKMLIGSDHYNPKFTLEEMQSLQKLGLVESEIIKGATIYPAQWLGVKNYYGSIESHKLANILIVNKNPLKNIKNLYDPYMVIYNGREVVCRGSTAFSH